jgi:hypothetical protein
MESTYATTDALEKGRDELDIGGGKELESDVA